MQFNRNKVTIHYLKQIQYTTELVIHVGNNDEINNALKFIKSIFLLDKKIL